MRIRKHAKLLGIMYSNTSSSTDLSPPPPPQPHICHLNQSPWDAMFFPPDSASSPYQVDGEGSLAAHGSLGDSIGAVESVASMKTPVYGDVKNNVEKVEDMEKKRDQLGGNGGIILCCKTDGKGWQCKKEAAQGHSLCNHHLTQLRMYNSLSSHPSGKKSDKLLEKSAAAATIRRRAQPRKASAVASNPYEYYYYSGFGPRWGKKRGTTRAEAEPSGTKPSNEADELGNFEAPPLSLSQIDHEEFDYVEEDDDDDEEEGNDKGIIGELGKKRVRKLIKARSLKSLM